MENSDPVLISTDNGTEFCGLAKFCRDNCNGLVPCKIAPYVLQKNGKIERLKRTLEERARAMLAASPLPEEYWGDHDALITFDC